MINESFRHHVTQVGFNLSLRRSHISALVYIDYMLKQNLSGMEKLRLYKQGDSVPEVPRDPFSRVFVPGVNGLQSRGLVEHIIDRRRKPGERVLDMRPRRIWRITPAGRLVINLLKEAGIYQEYAAMLPPIAGEVA